MSEPPQNPAALPDAPARAGGESINDGRTSAASPSRTMVSTRKGDTVALIMGVLLTAFLVGWLVWASVRNISRDRALVGSEVVTR